MSETPSTKTATTRTMHSVHCNHRPPTLLRYSHLPNSGEVLKVPVRENRIVVHVQAGALPVRHGGAKQASIAVLPSVKHHTDSSRACIVRVLHQLAQDAVQIRARRKAVRRRATFGMFRDGEGCGRGGTKGMLNTA